MSPSSPGERWRYIAFKVDSESSLARNDFLDALLNCSRGTSMERAFRITVFEGNFGIIKVPHKLKDEALRVLSSVKTARGRSCSVVPLKTSGTIKTLKYKYRKFIRKSIETID